MMMRRVAIQKLPVCSICILQLMDCEGHTLLFFLNPYMSNGIAKVIGVVIYNAVLQNGKPLISSVLRILIWLENLMTGGEQFQLT